MRLQFIIGKSQFLRINQIDTKKNIIELALIILSK